MHVSLRRSVAALTQFVLIALATSACGKERATPPSVIEHDEPSPVFRNVSNATAYVGDSACIACHQKESSSYASNSMAQSFHPWSTTTRIEPTLDNAILDARTGFAYTVRDSAGALYQIEFIQDRDGKRLHELSRRIDYVIGSGRVARSYFTQDNGRLYQLPLTWYRTTGWGMSPGYDFDNARFDRLLPDRCVACHSSYPKPYPHLEGKYETLNSGIGCERCHGPGALHVQERTTKVAVDSGFDKSIVNPRRVSLERRLDVCEQCHVHTNVSVPREGRSQFDYVPSRPLREQWAFFKAKGSIDLVSHADRLRQAKCFVATRESARPLECATCHDPHRTPVAGDSTSRNASCAQCHTSSALAQKLSASPARAEHAGNSDCVRCHMPNVRDRDVHGTFTDHWIRVVRDTVRRATANDARANALMVDAYYPRDAAGEEGRIYSAMGAVVQATLAKRGRAMGDAADSLRAALGSNTTRRDALFLLGVTYLQVGRAADAAKALEGCVRVDSLYPEANRALAQAYLFTDRPAKDIEHLYRRALDAQPALAWIRAEFADFLASEWRFPEAEHEYRLAVQEEPSRAAAWFNYGALLTAVSNAEEATQAFTTAIDLDPALAEGLTPLLDVRTKGGSVVGVKPIAIPIRALPARNRGSAGFALTIADSGHLAFLNVPPKALVLIARGDGMLLTALPTNDGGVRRWDMMTAPGHPIGQGLFKATLQARGADGQSLAPQSITFGVVRRRPE